MRKYGKNIWRAVVMALALVTLISSAGLQDVEAKAKAKTKKVVTLYFSATGTTRGAARKIRKATKSSLVEIKAKDPYTDDDLDYSNDQSRVSREHASAKSPARSKVRPEIANLKAIRSAVKKADVIYIGYPVWWGEAPHIVYSLVESVNLKGKTVIPFSTSISSGLGASGRHLKARAKISARTKWLKGRNFYGVPTQKAVNKWVGNLKY